MVVTRNPFHSVPVESQSGHTVCSQNHNMIEPKGWQAMFIVSPRNGVAGQGVADKCDPPVHGAATPYSPIPCELHRCKKGGRSARCTAQFAV
eukprot:3797350-Pyramimonas_sp.AAC.2